MEIQNASPTDTGTNSAAPLEPDLLSKISAASDRALDQFASTVKRKPGQRGPDKSPRRKKLPLGDVGTSSAETLLEESEAAGSPLDWNGSAPGLDDETAQALADVVFELFKDGRANFLRLKAFQITGDKTLAEQFVGTISEKLEAAMRKSAKACVIKYGAQIEYAPEITLLGAAAIIIIGDFLRLRMLKADTEKMKAA